jgi:sugar O-acyltransferase (sialic acid O-acetyltransferase NeuD family)
MVVADIVRLGGVYTIVGFLDSVYPDRHGTEFCGAPVLGGKEQLGLLWDRGIRHVLLGFGDCKMRLELTEYLEARGFSLPVMAHPRSTVAADAVLGSGTVIAAGAVVNPGATLGRSVIVNTLASVGHECRIGDAVHVSPGANLAGRVTVGRATQIGIGAKVIERIQIGAGVVVGAGAVVVRDIPDDAVAYGVPARVMRALGQ